MKIEVDFKNNNVLFFIIVNKFWAFSSLVNEIFTEPGHSSSKFDESLIVI